MISSARQKMTLRYANGQAIEAVLLSQSEGRMRVVLRGGDDVVELNQINGAWVTDDCEAVQVMFAWERPEEAPVTEADCICSPELAAKLIRLLKSAENAEEESQTATIAAPALAAQAARVV